MGFTLPSFWRATTPPTTAQLNEQRALDATATLELEGAQAPQSKTITDGSISPTAAYVIVDTEGSATADDLDVINPVLSGSENLHDGMIVHLKAADSGRVVTVKNSGSANGINTYDGNDYVLSTTHWLKLQLRSGKWYEVEGRAMETALAAAAASGGIALRMDAVEAKNTQQDTRLDSVESGVTAISTTLIGSIQTLLCADGYVPNGTVPADAAEYTRAQFPILYDNYLVPGKLVTCTYAEFAAQVALTGNCGKFALDTSAQKFKVPLLKDGDSITQASSASELGKSVKAGLPNFAGWTGVVSADGTLTGPFYKSSAVFGVRGGDYYTAPGIYFDPSRVNGIYGNSTTVTDEQVRLRHFVVLASAQNNASMFDWSNYMAGLAGKANLDMDNMTRTGTTAIAHFAMPSSRSITVAVSGTSNSYVAPADGYYCFNKDGSPGQGAYISNTTSGLFVSGTRGPYSVGLIMPVRRGDNITYMHNLGGDMYLAKFFYAEGAY